MGLKYQTEEGHTLLEPEERIGLKIPTVTSRHELNEFEQLNIEKAMQWSLSRKLSAKELLTEKFITSLHQRMYGDVWSWAGHFRKTNKNIGIDRSRISIELRKLLDDCAYWIENNTYVPDEICMRFKHRLVYIHVFPNGNGRHSRLMADLMISHVFHQPVFSWGKGKLSNKSLLRQKYLQALRAGDQGDYAKLLYFSRS